MYVVTYAMSYFNGKCKVDSMLSSERSSVVLGSLIPPSKTSPEGEDHADWPVRCLCSVWDWAQDPSRNSMHEESAASPPQTSLPDTLWPSRVPGRSGRLHQLEPFACSTSTFCEGVPKPPVTIMALVASKYIFNSFTDVLQRRVDTNCTEM